MCRVGALQVIARGTCECAGVVLGACVGLQIRLSNTADDLCGEK